MHQAQPLRYQGACGAASIQRGTYSQQGVNTKIKIFRWLFRHGYLGSHGFFVGRLSVGQQRGFAGTNTSAGHHNAFAPSVQVQRCLKPVTPVIARSAGDPYALSVRRKGTLPLASATWTQLEWVA